MELRRQKPAHCAYLSALGFQVNSGEAVFRQYFNEVG